MHIQVVLCATSLLWHNFMWAALGVHVNVHGGVYREVGIKRGITRFRDLLSGKFYFTLSPRPALVPKT